MSQPLALQPLSTPALAANQSPSGIPGLASLNRFLQSPSPGNGQAKDVLFDDPQGEANEAYNKLVYQSQVQRLAISAQFKEAAARIVQSGADGEGTAVEASAKQLAFDFFFESKTEQLELFSKRSGETADKLGANQATLFRATSERIAVRFSLSASISGASLQGFNNAAEGAAGDGDEPLVDKLLKTANDLLSQGDEFFNKVFALFDGFLKDDGDFTGRINTLLDGLRELGLVTFGPIGQGQGGAAPAGGKTAQFSSESFSFQLEFSFQYERTEVVQESDPIVFDLDGDGVELTSYKNGAAFDITATGRNTTTAFVTGGDAFLALDRNRNGFIDDGSELFGDQRGAANGFEELRKLDSNADGVIDRNDAGYADLLLFRDNGDGKTEAGELLSLADAGIASLALNYRDTNIAAAGGNRLAQISSFTRNDGSKGFLADAVLNYVV